jgi:hypothetical protein
MDEQPVRMEEPIGIAVPARYADTYVITKGETLRNYRIEIEFLSIGCLIRVGCKSIPFSTVKEGMKALNEYVDDPVLLMKIWTKRFSEEE